MDHLFFGLTLKALGILAYDFADKNNITHPFRNQTAGKGWTKGFLNRHPEISLRAPEPTSIARATGFNSPQVERFFQLLRTLYVKHGFRACDLYNCDETGFQTSAYRPPKVVSLKGKRQVGVVASAERGRTVTAICCCNAIGQFVPPALIFPCKKMNDPRLLDATPPGTKGMCSPTGWVNIDLFRDWLEFFVQQVKPTEQRPVLLLVDNHESHRAVAVLEYALAHHMVMMSVPPHTTHKLQPLDRTVYGPLSTYFEQAVDAFQKQNAGQRIQMTDIGRIFGNAYMRACTIQNATSGFAKCGIHPYDMNIFAPSLVTDRAGEPVPAPPEGNQPQQALEAVAAEPQTPEAAEPQPPQAAEPQPIEATEAGPPEAVGPQPPEAAERQPPEAVGPQPPLEAEHQTPQKTEPQLPLDALEQTHCTAAGHAVVTPSDIQPIPKAGHLRVQSRKRRTLRAEILTSSPVKKLARDRAAAATRKGPSTTTRGSRGRGGRARGGRGQGTVSRGRRGCSGRARGGTGQGRMPSKDLATEEGPPTHLTTEPAPSTSAAFACLVCGDQYSDPPIEDWIQCYQCHDWAHDACTSYEGGAYVCDNCM